jgi:hypothetical protein
MTSTFFCVYLYLLTRPFYQFASFVCVSFVVVYFYEAFHVRPCLNHDVLFFMYLFLFVEHAERLCGDVVRHTCMSAECDVMVRRAMTSHPRDLENTKCT